MDVIVLTLILIGLLCFEFIFRLKDKRDKKKLLDPTNTFSANVQMNDELYRVIKLTGRVHLPKRILIYEKNFSKTHCHLPYTNGIRLTKSECDNLVGGYVSLYETTNLKKILSYSIQHLDGMESNVIFKVEE